MRIVFGSDHSGFAIKGDVMAAVKQAGHGIVDVGGFTAERVDFPDIAKALTGKILSGEAERGIMICGTGIGACIAANKVKGIRASVCHDWHSAHQGVEHDGMNVLCLGAKIIGLWLALDLVNAFLGANFFGDNEYFPQRLKKLCAMEDLAFK